MQIHQHTSSPFLGRFQKNKIPRNYLTSCNKLRQKRNKKNLKWVFNSWEKGDFGKSRILTLQHEISSFEPKLLTQLFQLHPFEKVDARDSIEIDLSYRDDSYEIIMKMRKGNAGAINKRIEYRQYFFFSFFWGKV